MLVQGEVSLKEDSRSDVATAAKAAAGSQRGARSIVVQWLASPTSDMVADCAIGVLLQALSAPSLLRRSMADDATGIRLGSSQSATKRKGCSHNHYHSHGGSTSSSEDNPVIKRMKRGDLDPSKALPADALALLCAVEQAGATQEAALKQHAVRLQRLQHELHSTKAVKAAGASVAVSADGLKLIFSAKRPKAAPAEAYVFVVFNSVTAGAAVDESSADVAAASKCNGKVKKEAEADAGSRSGSRHDAVVKCDDEALKAAVLAALHEAE